MALDPTQVCAVSRTVTVPQTSEYISVLSTERFPSWNVMWYLILLWFGLMKSRIKFNLTCWGSLVFGTTKLKEYYQSSLWENLISFNNLNGITSQAIHHISLKPLNVWFKSWNTVTWKDLSNIFWYEQILNGEFTSEIILRLFCCLDTTDINWISWQTSEYLHWKKSPWN